MTQLNTYKGLDYSSLVEWMNGRVEKKLAHNTYCLLEDDHIDVKYHSSVIASVYSDKLILTNDGYFTSTTKLRLNWFLNKYRYTISQVHYEWIVYPYGRWVQPVGKFTGEIEYSIQDDTFTGLSPMEDNTRKKEIKRIKNFARKYAKAMLAAKIATPSLGDCLYCRLDFPDDYDHIDSHIEESYFVPSLLVKAVSYKRVSPIVGSFIGMLWYQNEKPDFLLDLAESQLYTSLWAYMLHCYDKSPKNE